MGFPQGTDGKESNTGDLDSISGWGRSPRGEHGYPLQYSCLKNSMDKGVWQATSPWGHKESNTSQFDSTGESES